MATGKLPIRVYFNSSNLITSEHLEQNTLSLLGQLLYVVEGFVTHNYRSDEHYSGALHPDYFKITYDASAPQTIKISPGVGLVFKTGEGNSILVLPDEAKIDVATLGLATDTTYYVYLKYEKELSDSLTAINPISGVESNVLEVEVYDTDSVGIVSGFGFEPNYFIIFSTTQATSTEEQNNGLLYIGSIKIAPDLSNAEIHGGRLLPIRIPFLDNDPENRVPDTITPSVEPYTDLQNFLACKGNAPRTIENPFGLAYKDIGGARDYYEILTVSSILKKDTNDYLSLKPDRDEGEHGHVRVHKPLGGDYFIVGGVRTEGNNILIDPDYTENGDDYLIELPIDTYALYEIWFLTLWYDESNGKFWLKWTGGTPSSPVWNQPLLTTNDLNDWRALNGDTQYQYVNASAFPVLKDFFLTPNFYPILLIGRNNSSTSELGVFHSNPEDPSLPAQFDNTGKPGDLRRYHFMDIDKLRLKTLPSSWGRGMEQEIREAISNLLYWHMSYRNQSSDIRHDTDQIKSTFIHPEQGSDPSLTATLRAHEESLPDPADYVNLISKTNSDGKRYLHHADRILRKEGYKYLQNEANEEDVDSSLNVIVDEVEKLKRQGSYALFKISPSGSITEDKNNLQEIVNKINNLPIYGAAILFTPYYDGDTVRFIFDFGDGIFEFRKPVLFMASPAVKIQGGNFSWKAVVNDPYGLNDNMRQTFIPSGITGGLWVDNGFLIDTNSATLLPSFVLKDTTIQESHKYPTAEFFSGFLSAKDGTTVECLYGAFYENVTIIPKQSNITSTDMAGFIDGGFSFLPFGKWVVNIDNLLIKANFPAVTLNYHTWHFFSLPAPDNTSSEGVLERSLKITNSYFDLSIDLGVGTRFYFLRVEKGSRLDFHNNHYSFNVGATFKYFLYLHQYVEAIVTHQNEFISSSYGLDSYGDTDGADITPYISGIGNKNLPAPKDSFSTANQKPDTWEDLNW